MKKMKKTLVVLAAVVAALTMTTTAFAADLGDSDSSKGDLPVSTGDNGMTTAMVLGAVALASASTVAIVAKSKKKSK
ncbi:MAG: LPXTG cell wall anchor domain-containing protein [Acutalibacteraceae bacterium]